MDFSLMIVEYMTGYFFNKMFWSWSWPLNCTLTYFSVIVDKHVVFLRQPFEKSSGNQVCPSQWGKLTLANVSAFWAGQVENWPGRVEFCIEHIKDTCFRRVLQKFSFPHCFISSTGIKNSSGNQVCLHFRDNYLNLIWKYLHFQHIDWKLIWQSSAVFISMTTIWISSENVFISSTTFENSSDNETLSSFPWQLFEFHLTIRLSRRLWILRKLSYRNNNDVFVPFQDTPLWRVATVAL